MAPPLKPKHPEAQPPMKAVITQDLTVLLLNLISLGIKPLPTLVLRACSAIILLTATTDIARQMHTYTPTNIQSPAPQCSRTDLVCLLPLRALITSWDMSTTVQIACLSHCQWVFSLSSILSTKSISYCVGPLLSIRFLDISSESVRAREFFYLIEVLLIESLFPSTVSTTATEPLCYFSVFSLSALSLASAASFAFLILRFSFR